MVCQPFDQDMQSRPGHAGAAVALPTSLVLMSGEMGSGWCIDH